MSQISEYNLISIVILAKLKMTTAKPKNSLNMDNATDYSVSQVIRIVLLHIYMYSSLLTLSNSFSLSFLFSSYLVSFVKSDVPPSHLSFIFFFLWLFCDWLSVSLLQHLPLPLSHWLDFPFTLCPCESNCTFYPALCVNVMPGWNNQYCS